MIGKVRRYDVRKRDMTDGRTFCLITGSQERFTLLISGGHERIASWSWKSGARAASIGACL